MKRLCIINFSGLFSFVFIFVKPALSSEKNAAIFEHQLPTTMCYEFAVSVKVDL